MKHFSPGIKIGNSGSGISQRKKCAEGPSSRLLTSQKGSCWSLSLFSHTSGFQKLKAFSVLWERESVFVMSERPLGRAWLCGKCAGLPLRPQGSVSPPRANPVLLRPRDERCSLAGPGQHIPFALHSNSQSTYLLGKKKSLLLLRNNSHEITGSL